MPFLRILVQQLVLVKKFEPSYLVVGSKLRYKESHVYAVEIGENGKEEAEKLVFFFLFYLKVLLLIHHLLLLIII